MAYGPPPFYGIRTPPLLCHMNRFYWGWWSLICWQFVHATGKPTTVRNFFDKFQAGLRAHKKGVLRTTRMNLEGKAAKCRQKVCSSKRLAKASAPYRGQNRQNREKRVSGSKNSHFPVSQKWALCVKKSPFLYRAPQGKWGFFWLKAPISGTLGNGSFLTPKPSFPDFGDFDPCRGRTLSQQEAPKMGTQKCSTNEVFENLACRICPEQQRIGQGRSVQEKSLRANDPIKTKKMKGALSLNNLLVGTVRPPELRRPTRKPREKKKNRDWRVRGGDVNIPLSLES